MYLLLQQFQVFRVPLEEVTSKHFGQFGDGRQHMCRDVTAKTGAAIEMSYAKDKSLNILATGKPAQVAMARREILKRLQTQVGWIVPVMYIYAVVKFADCHW